MKQKATSKDAKRDRLPAEAAPPAWARYPRLTVFAVFALATLIFYWVPLTDANTTPQWDTIDYHYSVQKFAGEELTSFRLPQWTEYAFSGYPFLADPQTGTWYPLNWPFFLYGVTPKALQAEIALHVLLASVGAWLLAYLWLHNRLQAGLAAVTYAFSGFFAGHSSHLGMLQTAAWLPLLLYGVHVSIRTLRVWPVVLTGAGCACLFLAGHFQSALYSFAAIGVYAIAVAAMEKRWAAAAWVLAACAISTVALSAIQWLPAAQLASESTRSGMTFTKQTNAPLEPRALITLVHPDVYGSASGDYKGPEDRTQFYFYGGIALLPLAVAGLMAGRLRWAALALVIPFLWYAFGPAAGLYTIAAQLPGLSAVRAPVHAWFVVALGMALLAGAGLGVIQQRFGIRWLAMAVALFAFVDVLYWNSLANHLAYGRQSFATTFGNAQRDFDFAVRRYLPQGSRFHSPHDSPSFGPLNHAYDMRLPVTYGSNPLMLKRYMEHFSAANGNARLMNGLHAGMFIEADTGRLRLNPAILPRFFFPRTLAEVSPGTGASRLATADPVEASLVDGSAREFQQDANGKVTIDSANFERYVLRTETAGPSLLRASIPWYPAWRLRIDGKDTPIRIVDHALIGIPVPSGQHEVVLEYNAAQFRIGATITVLSIALAAAAAIVLRRRQSSSSPATI